MSRAEGMDFWSRRRAAVRAEEAALAAREAEELRDTASETAVAEERTDTEILEELGLRDPDTMGQGDDFAAFMKAAVPEHLRRRALRRLWLSNPVLANLDGLVDHGEDFTDAATVLPGMQTTYQVGKGMLRHVIELAEKSAAASEDEPEVAPEADPEVALAEAAEEPEADPVRETDDDAAPVPRRHMRFAFTGEVTHG